MCIRDRGGKSAAAAADFPPNSTTAGTALSAAACKIAFPVFTDPVKLFEQRPDEQLAQLQLRLHIP